MGSARRGISIQGHTGAAEYRQKKIREGPGDGVGEGSRLGETPRGVENTQKGVAEKRRSLGGRVERHIQTLSKGEPGSSTAIKGGSGTHSNRFLMCKVLLAQLVIQYYEPISEVKKLTIRDDVVKLQNWH